MRGLADGGLGGDGSIIALHGINGHAFGTWLARDIDGEVSKEVMWLKDFLARDFPQYRVLVYGYDADLKSSGDGDLMALTRGLRDELEMVRRTEEVSILFASPYSGLFVEFRPPGF